MGGIQGDKLREQNTMSQFYNPIYHIYKLLNQTIPSPTLQQGCIFEATPNTQAISRMASANLLTQTCTPNTVQGSLLTP